MMLLLTMLLVSVFSQHSAMPTNKPESFYDLQITTIEGEVFRFEQLRGKKVLLVNTASECGNTPQYAELQQLHEEYGHKLVIIGFPSNDFGGQEPGNHEEIKAFCEKHYGVDFLLSEKVHVTGNEISEVYAWLTQPSLNGWNSDKPQWNFAKYLVNENGDLLAYFPASMSPMSEALLDML
jgi:glutathione peroxidase